MNRQRWVLQLFPFVNEFLRSCSGAWKFETNLMTLIESQSFCGQFICVNVDSPIRRIQSTSRWDKWCGAERPAAPFQWSGDLQASFTSCVTKVMNTLIRWYDAHYPEICRAAWSDTFISGTFSLFWCIYFWYSIWVVEDENDVTESDQRSSGGIFLAVHQPFKVLFSLLTSSVPDSPALHTKQQRLMNSEWMNTNVVFYLLISPINHLPTPPIHRRDPSEEGPPPRDGNHCPTVCLCVCVTAADTTVVVYLGQRHGAESCVQSSVKWTRRSAPSLLCCIFVRPQSLVLMISPAAFCPPLTTQQSRCESIGRCPHRRCATRHPAHRREKTSRTLPASTSRRLSVKLCRPDSDGTNTQERVSE